MVLRSLRPLWKKGLKDKMIGSFVKHKLLAFGGNKTTLLFELFSGLFLEMVKTVKFFRMLERSVFLDMCLQRGVLKIAPW